MLSACHNVKDLQLKLSFVQVGGRVNALISIPELFGAVSLGQWITFLIVAILAKSVPLNTFYAISVGIFNTQRTYNKRRVFNRHIDTLFYG